MFSPNERYEALFKDLNCPEVFKKEFPTIEHAAALPLDRMLKLKDLKSAKDIKEADIVLFKQRADQAGAASPASPSYVQIVPQLKLPKDVEDVLEICILTVSDPDAFTYNKLLHHVSTSYPDYFNLYSWKITSGGYIIHNTATLQAAVSSAVRQADTRKKVPPAVQVQMLFKAQGGPPFIDFKDVQSGMRCLLGHVRYDELHGASKMPENMRGKPIIQPYPMEEGDAFNLENIEELEMTVDELLEEVAKELRRRRITCSFASSKECSRRLFIDPILSNVLLLFHKVLELPQKTYQLHVESRLHGDAYGDADYLIKSIADLLAILETKAEEPAMPTSQVQLFAQMHAVRRNRLKSKKRKFSEVESSDEAYATQCGVLSNASAYYFYYFDERDAKQPVKYWHMRLDWEILDASASIGEFKEAIRPVVAQLLGILVDSHQKLVKEPNQMKQTTE